MRARRFESVFGNRFWVAQATRLYRPATRRTARKQWFEAIRSVFSQRGSAQFRSAGRRPGRASRPRHPFSRHGLSRYKVESLNGSRGRGALGPSCARCNLGNDVTVQRINDSTIQLLAESFSFLSPVLLQNKRRQELGRDRLLSPFRTFSSDCEPVLAVAVFVRGFDVVAPSGLQRDWTGLLPRVGCLRPHIPRPVSREHDLSDLDPIDRV